MSLSVDTASPAKLRRESIEEAAHGEEEELIPETPSIRLPHEPEAARVLSDALGEGEELTLEKLRAFIEQQREFSETVSELGELMRMVAMTNASHIAQLYGSEFRHTGPKAKERQRALVEASRKGMAEYTTKRNQFTADGARAIVEASVVALCNDLMLDPDVQDFFGVNEYNMDLVHRVMLTGDANVSMWHADVLPTTTALCIYRMWQILLRTEVGRKTVLGSVQGPLPERSPPKPGQDEETDYDSFDLICKILSTELMYGRIPVFLEACFRGLPRKSCERYKPLSPKEINLLERAFANQEIYWPEVRPVEQ